MRQEPWQLGIERQVVRAVAEACRSASGTVGPRSRLADLAMDSLTLVAVLARMEAVFGVDFGVDETLEALGAEDVAGLAAAVARAVGRRSRR